MKRIASIIASTTLASVALIALPTTPVEAAQPKHWKLCSSVVTKNCLFSANDMAHNRAINANHVSYILWVQNVNTGLVKIKFISDEKAHNLYVRDHS